MVKIENDCICCEPYCAHCGADKTPHWYCDECGDEYEPEELANYDGEMLCETCLFNSFSHYSYSDLEG